MQKLRTDPYPVFIETAAIRYPEEIDYADEFEMQNIFNIADLVGRMKKGVSDALKGRGRFV